MESKKSLRKLALAALTVSGVLMFTASSIAFADAPPGLGDPFAGSGDAAPQNDAPPTLQLNTTPNTGTGGSGSGTVISKPKTETVKPKVITDIPNKPPVVQPKRSISDTGPNTAYYIILLALASGAGYQFATKKARE